MNTFVEWKIWKAKSPQFPPVLVVFRSVDGAVEDVPPKFVHYVTERQKDYFWESHGKLEIDGSFVVVDNGGGVE